MQKCFFDKKPCIEDECISYVKNKCLFVHALTIYISYNDKSYDDQYYKIIENINRKGFSQTIQNVEHFIIENKNRVNKNNIVEEYYKSLGLQLEDDIESINFYEEIENFLYGLYDCNIIPYTTLDPDLCKKIYKKIIKENKQHWFNYETDEMEVEIIYNNYNYEDYDKFIKEILLETKIYYVKDDFVVFRTDMEKALTKIRKQEKEENYKKALSYEEEFINYLIRLRKPKILITNLKDFYNMKKLYLSRQETDELLAHFKEHHEEKLKPSKKIKK